MNLLVVVLAISTPFAFANQSSTNFRGTISTRLYEGVENGYSRGLEDADGDYEEVNDNSNDDTIMMIEQEVETTLVDMFYNAPSEWSTRHWAFFAGMVAIVSIVLCWFCACCVIPCCCCPTRRDSVKPLVVKTQDEYNHYTNDLMKDDAAKNKKADTEKVLERPLGLDQMEDAISTSSSESGGSNMDSSVPLSSGETESFQDEYEESDSDAYEHTNSHGQYYKFKGRHRRQLT